VTAIAFFLAGVPVGWLAQRLIRLLSDVDELEYDDPEAGVVRRQLPWQTPEWAARVGWGVAGLVPFAFIYAGLNFSTLQALSAACLVTALLICVATDLLSYRVPDVVTYPATALALVAALVLPDANPLSSVAAALLAGAFFLGVSVLAPRGGLGLGDVKLAVMIGAALGLPAAFQALLAGMVVTGALMLALLLVGVISRRQAVPYAPFLALSAAAFVLLQGPAFAPL
jgi:leader peptidase (prepilin peptidase)/N-methyltransferase